MPFALTSVCSCSCSWHIGLFRTKKTVARTSSKIDKLQSVDSASQDGESRELCGAYNPPKPENIRVGVEIQVGP
eukprot:COSAG03_NODE_188_length_10927_cov_5.525028_8_plen_74_part_00